MRIPVLILTLLAALGMAEVSPADTPVGPAASWHGEGQWSFGRYGRSVAGIGDANRDGFGDVIIGVPTYESQFRSGSVFMYRGSADGLAGAPQWRYLNYDQIGTYVGHSVSWAGDLNEDGLDDMIAGAPMFVANGTVAGRAVVFFGHSGAGPGTPFFMPGLSAGSRFGSAVCGAGDVNGDGVDDLVIGAERHHGGIARQGAVFLFPGPRPISLVPTWQHTSGSVRAELGATLAGMGDINGDGYNDVLAGAPGYDGVGAVFVYFGDDNGLGAGPAHRIDGAVEGAGFGSTMALADVNGDGFSDVVIGVPLYFEEGSGDLGRVLVYTSTGTSGELNEPVVLSNGINQFGLSVANAGDLNWDGYDDLLSGNRQFLTDAAIEVAYIYLGGKDGPGPVADQSILRAGGGTYGAFAATVGGAGDVNDDQIPDVIIANETEPFELKGEAFVYHGNPGRGRILESAGWSMPGEDEGTVSAVDAAGDVNGDGWPDLLIGDHLDSDAAPDGGSVRIYAGSAQGWSSTPMWEVSGTETGAWLGWRCVYAGDVNGDGYDDVAVAAPHGSTTAIDEGTVHVFLGSDQGPSVQADFVFGAGQRGAVMGQDLAAAGDVNGDGFGDFIVGAFRYSAVGDDRGRALVYLGNPHSLSDSLRWIVDGDQAGAWFGYTVALAGDVDRDGYDDLVVGAPYYDNGESDEGALFVYRGSADGLLPQADLLEVDREGARLGISLSSAGDADGNGHADILAGAGGSAVAMSGLGNAFIFYGGPEGVRTSRGWSTAGPLIGSSYGSAVRGLGDVDGDGYSDIAVGDPGYDGSPGNDCGRVSVFFGSATGVRGTAAHVIDGATAGAVFGGLLSAPGDVSGDGWFDMVAAGRRGRVDLFVTSGSPALRVHPRQVDPLGATVAKRGFSGEETGFNLRVDVTRPLSATWIRLEFQVRVDGGPWEDTGPSDVLRLGTHQRRAGARVTLDHRVGLRWFDRNVAWRVRVVTSAPLKRRSKWFYHPGSIAGQTTIRNGLAPEVDPPPPPEPPPTPAGNDVFYLLPPRPNPSNPDVTVRFKLENEGAVRVSIYDVAGRLVTVLVDDVMLGGPHNVRWGGEARSGERVASGVYFVHLEANGRRMTQKLVLTR